MVRPRKSGSAAEGPSRLETYPKWYWDVLEHCKRGAPYARSFEAKNHAVNAMHRYHYFRRDCIRERIPGAAMMTEYPCSMGNASKTLLHWVFIGQMADYAAELAEQGPDTRTAVVGPEVAQGGYVPQVGGDTSAGERVLEAWLRQPDDAIAGPDDLSIPALDLASTVQGEPLPPCPPHEPDATGVRCVKCNAPLLK